MEELIQFISAIQCFGGVSYSYGEGTNILDDASRIAGIESLTAPVPVGDIDLYYSADSAFGSLFDAE